MEILSSDHLQDLLNYLPHVKSSVREWFLVDIKIIENAGGDLTVLKVAEITHALFSNKEGKIYLCNSHEILILIHWGKADEAKVVGEIISSKLPEKSCKVNVQPPTAEGITKLELVIGHRESAALSLAYTRSSRKENVIMVADDDMYMRMLVKKGAQAMATVHEVADGNEVMAAYKKYMPDVLFLDIHLPGRDGTTLLNDILAIDSAAYIIMLSADSSPENVEFTTSKGAKGFLTKPFTKEKLLEYIQKCPTLS